MRVEKMRHILIDAYLSVIWIANLLVSILADLSGWTDWSFIGAAFAGSTAFVLFEVINRTERSGRERAAMIILGFLVSVFCSGYVSEKWGASRMMVAFLLAAVGYKAFSFLQKKADKPEEIIKDLPHK